MCLKKYGLVPALLLCGHDCNEQAPVIPHLCPKYSNPRLYHHDAALIRGNTNFIARRVAHSMRTFSLPVALVLQAAQCYAVWGDHPNLQSQLQLTTGRNIHITNPIRFPSCILAHFGLMLIQFTQNQAWCLCICGPMSSAGLIDCFCLTPR